jgi:hypothetical protein
LKNNEPHVFCKSVKTLYLLNGIALAQIHGYWGSFWLDCNYHIFCIILAFLFREKIFFENMHEIGTNFPPPKILKMA